MPLMAPRALVGGTATRPPRAHPPPAATMATCTASTARPRAGAGSGVSPAPPRHFRKRRALGLRKWRLQVLSLAQPAGNTPKQRAHNAPRNNPRSMPPPPHPPRSTSPTCAHPTTPPQPWAFPGKLLPLLTFDVHDVHRPTLKKEAAAHQTNNMMRTPLVALFAAAVCGAATATVLPDSLTDEKTSHHPFTGATQVRVPSLCASLLLSV